MLENPVYPTGTRRMVLAMGSDNLVGADNQQERLIQLGWVIGFVDGEGCFSIGFIRQPGGRGRSGYKTGYQVAHEFAVTQGESSLSALRGLEQFFGVGMLVPNRRSDDHREHLYRYVVRRRADLQERIIPFFQEHPLQTAKQENFEKFARCVSLISEGRHRTVDGLIEIAEITETMNRRKPRTKLIRILRDHTPDIRDIG
jgi:LAGLIDADG endonuclease